MTRLRYVSAMLNPYLALPVRVALGVWIISYARSAYRKPLALMQRSIPGLPERTWAVELFRGLSVVWIFGGFLIISQGIVMLPSFADHHGLPMLAWVLGVDAAATAIVLRFTRREREASTVVRDGR
jgi:hypothetical protein